MHKSIFIALFGVFLFLDAKSQQRDSLVFYYQYDNVNAHEVSTRDSADYFRAVILPMSGEKLCTAKEYYKDGQIKLIGKFDPGPSNLFKNVNVRFLGELTRYYPNGKKQIITHYDNVGYKEGDEYTYYTNGFIYCYVKNYLANGSSVKRIDCYDDKGTKICSEGNGTWIIYDPDFKRILLRGQVKNGLMEGEWYGSTLGADSIRYVYNYHKDKIISSLGYDKSGKSYPFDAQNPAAAANYQGGPITFIKIFKNHLTLPKAEDGNKSSLNDIQISFNVEKDGHLTNFEVLGTVTPEMKKALNDALNNCHQWMPTTYYGIPLRTQIILPLKFIHGYTGSGRFDYYREELFFQEKVLDFN